MELNKYKLWYLESSVGKTSSSSNSPAKRSKLTSERDVTGGSAWNLVFGNFTYNKQEPGVIHEELCEYEQQVSSPMSRLEENKSSLNEDSFEINDCLMPEGVDVEFNSNTPRFEQDSNHFTIMLWKGNEESIPKIKTSKFKTV